MNPKVMIGVVKLFQDGRGVIAPQPPSESSQAIRDLYFEDEPAKFRPGQLVRFQLNDDSSRAVDVAVLSEKY